jgi:hypothetical protein
VAAGKTGTNNVVVTLSGAADRLAVIAFTATGCGGPGLDTNTAGGNLSVVSAAIDTAADTGRVVGLWTGAAARGVTPGTGNTVVVARDDGTAPPNNIVAWAGWEPGTGGSVAWDITLSSAVRAAAAVIELLEAEAGGGGTDELTAGSLTAGAPVLGTPAIGQAHALAADGLVAGAPTLGEPLFVFAVGKVTVSVTGGKPGMTVTAGGPSLSVVAASPHMDIGD